MQKILATVAAVVVACLLSAHKAEAAPIALVQVLPSLTESFVGDALSVGISIGDVTDLFDYQFDINFNPAVLRAELVVDGGFLTSAGGTSVFDGPFALTIDNTTGVISFLDSLLGPVPPATGVTGTGLLARINFTALAVGFSDISFASAILEDSSGLPIDYQLVDGRVAVAERPGSVPEPGTILLLAPALVVLARKARNRRRS